MSTKQKDRFDRIYKEKEEEEKNKSLSPKA